MLNLLGLAVIALGFCVFGGGETFAIAVGGSVALALVSLWQERRAARRRP